MPLTGGAGTSVSPYSTVLICVMIALHVYMRNIHLKDIIREHNKQGVRPK